MQLPNDEWLKLGYEEWDLSRDKFDGTRETATKPHVTFFGGYDHEYDRMYDLMGSLTYGDVMVAVGSSDQIVLPTFLVNGQVTKLRVNLQKRSEYFYDKHFIGQSSEQLRKVEKWLDERM